jgi:hypothetical protein
MTPTPIPQGRLYPAVAELRQPDFVAPAGGAPAIVNSCDGSTEIAKHVASMKAGLGETRGSALMTAAVIKDSDRR